jgi:hypothetical protein
MTDYPPEKRARVDYLCRLATALGTGDRLSGLPERDPVNVMMLIGEALPANVEDDVYAMAMEDAWDEIMGAYYAAHDGPHALCTACEERPAVMHGYDEHNGPFALCAECRDNVR